MLKLVDNNKVVRFDSRIKKSSKQELKEYFDVLSPGPSKIFKEQSEHEDSSDSSYSEYHKNRIIQKQTSKRLKRKKPKNKQNADRKEKIVEVSDDSDSNFEENITKRNFGINRILKSIGLNKSDVASQEKIEKLLDGGNEK